MNCIQPTAPAEEGPMLVPNPLSIPLIAASNVGALKGPRP